MRPGASAEHDPVLRGLRRLVGMFVVGLVAMAFMSRTWVDAMSLIEQAARRLEQLRQAGVVVPDDVPAHRARFAAVRAAGPWHPLPSGAAVATSAVGHLDLEMLAAKGIVTPNAPRSFMADQYRVIKRP
jgi:hypothetical protein